MAAPIRLIGAVGVAALIAAGSAPSPAPAATYTVHNCVLPNGQPATTEGWSWTAISPRANTITCRPGKPTLAMWVLQGAVHPGGDGVELTYNAPPATEVEGYSIWRKVTIQPGSSFNYYYQLFEGVRDGEHIVDRCHGIDGCTGLSGQVDRSGLEGVRQLWLQVGCQSNAECPPASSSPEAAMLEVTRMDIRLADETPPVLTTTPSGTLLDGRRALTGPQAVTVAASDVGGGVYQALFEVDGEVVEAQTIDANEGKCAVPFAVTVPCPANATGTLEFDTSELRDGEHLVRILVTDATGTNAAPYGPVRVRTLNSPCRQAATPRTKLRLRAAFGGRRGKRRAGVRFGRPTKVRGNLTGRGGEPIAGARICVAEKVAAPGARLRPLDSVRTSRRGRFVYKVEPGPSRTIRFAHRTGAGKIAATKVHLRVRAGVGLRAKPRTLRNGERVKLIGRLRGRPYPRKGALVELQARRPGKWQTFGTTRSNSHGRFRFGYRFTRTPVTQTYSLRARVPGQPSYPYASGASDRVRVRVLGD
jgi:hypothetical protein